MAGRNLLLFITLGLLMVGADRTSLAWLPAFTWTMIGLVFAADESTELLDWWAFCLEPTATGLHLVVVGVLFVLALLFYSGSSMGTLRPVWERNP